MTGFMVPRRKIVCTLLIHPSMYGVWITSTYLPIQGWRCSGAEIGFGRMPVRAASAWGPRDKVGARAPGPDWRSGGSGGGGADSLVSPCVRNGAKNPWKIASNCRLCNPYTKYRLQITY